MVILTTGRRPTIADFEKEVSAGGLTAVSFQADSALLRELGERLVGAPHVALAELVKNAYDADATLCSIHLEANRIVVADNGHGMSEEEFRHYWMTVGTRNKQNETRSRRFKRNVSGSKGVGRLSAQFLAHKLQLVTKSEDSTSGSIHALVDWDRAIDAGQLTKASALYRVEANSASDFPGDARTGTVVVMEGLKSRWQDSDVRNLGQQLWMLQSPFAGFGRTRTGSQDPTEFRVDFSTTLPGLDALFSKQMEQAISNSYAVVTGKLERKGNEIHSHVTVRFRDGDSFSETFVDEGAHVSSARWQIRVYNLSGKQAGGIPVQLARDYFERYGVMVFDAGFRLPYYGIDSDWLGIEYDHSHRRNRSELLPASMHVNRALNDLPTQGRLLGVVAIDTGVEAKTALPEQLESGEYLKILVTRDRLVDNAAYRQLTTAVRRSLDYYAVRQRIKVGTKKDAARPKTSPTEHVREVARLVEDAIGQRPDDETLQELRSGVTDLERTIKKQREADDVARSLLGPLASAGMAALAMQHENDKDIRVARAHVRTLGRLASERKDAELERVSLDLNAWLGRFEAGRRLFAPLLDPEDREVVETLTASGVVRTTLEGLAPILAGTDFDVAVPADLMLPAATFAEWYALFQNLVTNAANAMLDKSVSRISIVGEKTSDGGRLHVSDRGTGIDLRLAPKMFDPFERAQVVSQERKALTLGGMGLGLTIVRMIAEHRGCAVAFVQPTPGWSTTIELRWPV